MPASRAEVCLKINMVAIKWKPILLQNSKVILLSAILSGHFIIFVICTLYDFVEVHAFCLLL